MPCAVQMGMAWRSKCADGKCTKSWVEANKHVCALILYNTSFQRVSITKVVSHRFNGAGSCMGCDGSQSKPAAGIHLRALGKGLHGLSTSAKNKQRAGGLHASTPFAA